MTFEERKNEMMDWANREFNIVFEELEKGNASETEKNAYKIAITVYNNLLSNLDDDNEAALIPAEAILISLMRGDPLTPIEDNESDWTLVEDKIDIDKGGIPIPSIPGYRIYQNERRHSLFKKVEYHEDADIPNTITYSDLARAVCINVKNGQRYNGGFGYTVFNELHPIKMPYIINGEIRIFTEDFKYHEDCESDYDTFSVLYFRYPNGEIENVMRFFKMDDKTKSMMCIDKTEYFSRRKKYVDRVEKGKKW